MSINLLSIADYHVHPDFSFDAQGTLDEYCEAALARGLTEICFTTHYDTDPRLPEHHRQMRIDGRMVPVNMDNIANYIEAVSEAAEKYIGRELMVQCGIEVGYFQGCEKEIGELFSRYHFHHTIGSVHLADTVDICNLESMRSAPDKFDINLFGDIVYEDLIKSAECGLFDALGHIDLYKKYGVKVYGNDILNLYKGRLEKLFAAMKETETGFEINTSALRREHSEYYPSMAIVNLARAAGVKIRSVGSDAHKPDEVAYDFENASAVAYELTSPYCGE